MAAVEVDPGALGAAGTRVAGATATPMAGGPVIAPAADPVSMAASATLSARMTAITAHSAAALNITQLRAAMIAASADSYTAQEYANHTGLVIGSATPAHTSPMPAPGPAFVPPPSLIPPVAPSPPPGDGKTIATMIHTGSTAGLSTAEQHFRSHATSLGDAATHLRASATAVEQAWASPSGDAAAARLRELAAWHDDHAAHASSAAAATTQAADNYHRAIGAIPKPQAFTDAERELLTATAAAQRNPAYLPAVAAAQQKLTGLHTQASTGYTSYSAATTAAGLHGNPIDPPPTPNTAGSPAATPLGTGTDKSTDGVDDQIVGPSTGPHIAMVDNPTGPAAPAPPPPPGSAPEIGGIPVPPQVAAHAPPGALLDHSTDPTGGLLTPQNLPAAPTAPPPIPGVRMDPSTDAPSLPAVSAPAAPAVPPPDCDFGTLSKGIAEAGGGPIAILTTPVEAATGVGVLAALGQIALGYGATVDGLQIIEKCTG